MSCPDDSVDSRLVRHDCSTLDPESCKRAL